MLFRFDTVQNVLTAVVLIFLTAIGACSNTVNSDKKDQLNVYTTVNGVDSSQNLSYHFSRDTIIQQLLSKTKNHDLRLIHVLVPLCDNEHQGIVPVNASLGDGMNLRTNLYWGAGYGIKTHFVRSSTWVKVTDSLNPKPDVLERVVFRHSSQNVIMVADAYRGDRMKACLTDYFNELAGRFNDTVSTGDTTVVLGTATDLVVFNGHNGLMDVSIEPISNQDGKVKDAIAIACVSQPYFNPHLQQSGGYPLVFTAHLLAPEAYVLHAVLDSWVANKNDEAIRYSAAQGYHNIQKCGIRGASNLFVTGW